ncbi:Legumain [Nymphon striatum]|nr:Legumain [Nymphon striatum]
MILSVLLTSWLFCQAALSLPAEDFIKQAQSNGGNIYAVIVAGSNNYYNYRHQSDTAHAYQICISHGIPRSRIIMMAFNDIAENARNPSKGSIINKPNGPNVFRNVVIDYSKYDVTPANFLKVIKGDSSGMSGIGSGRVLQSGSQDHVFINMVDHGAPGIFAFPSGGYLNANVFIAALKTMHSQNKYFRMAIYLEACESGSMFNDKLPTNINIYATTAANEVQSSYACYYDSRLQTYLGDLYSVSWMEDTDSNDIRRETLNTQYLHTKKRTQGSEVKEYGSIYVSYDAAGYYEGLAAANEITPVETENIEAGPANNLVADSVDARDVPVFVEFNKLKDAKTLSEKEEIFKTLNEIISKRVKLMSRIKDIFHSAIETLDDKPSWEEIHVIKNTDCYHPIAERVHNKCFDVNQNEYVLQYFHKFVTLCERGVDSKLVHAAIDKHCTDEQPTGSI